MDEFEKSQLTCSQKIKISKFITGNSQCRILKTVYLLWNLSSYTPREKSTYYVSPDKL